MPPILGYFILVNLGDGCLGSKYGNYSNDRLLVECCARLTAPDPTDEYLGDYAVVWLDAVNPIEQTAGILKIKRKSLSQYTLTWHRENDEDDIFYHGEGMLCPAGLVGSYWNTPIQNQLR